MKTLFNRKKRLIKELGLQLTYTNDLLAESVDRIKDCNDEIEKLKSELSSIKDMPVKTENYYMDKELMAKYPQFIDYFDDLYDDKYFCSTLFRLSRNPELVVLLFKAILDFDFDSVEKFMRDNNWFWQDRKRSPNKYELIKCVFELSQMFLIDNKIELPTNDENYQEYASGGFYVKLTFDGDKPVNITIKFKQ